MKKNLTLFVLLLLATLFTACGKPGVTCDPKTEELKNGKCVSKTIQAGGSLCGTPNATCGRPGLISCGDTSYAECPPDSEDFYYTKSGKITECSFKCEKKKRDCSHDTEDGYCPAGCNDTNDVDCAPGAFFKPCYDPFTGKGTVTCAEGRICGHSYTTFEKGICTRECDDTHPCDVGVCNLNLGICVKQCTGSKLGDITAQGSCPQGSTCVNTKDLLAKYPNDLSKSEISQKHVEGVCLDFVEDDTCHTSPDSCTSLPGLKCGKLPGFNANHCFPYGGNSTAKYGYACSNTSQCSGGFNAACLFLSALDTSKAPADYKGGFCSEECKTDADCTKLDPKSVCVQISADGPKVCAQSCDNQPGSHDCDNIEGSTCGSIQLPDGSNKNICGIQSFNCEDPKNPGHPLKDACPNVLQSCTKVGSSFFCKNDVPCSKDPKDISKGGDDSQCTGGTSCRKKIAGWFCVEPESCDDGAGNADPSKCDDAYSVCAKDASNKWTCQPEYLCSTYADPLKPINSVCDTAGMSCQRAHDAYYCEKTRDCESKTTPGTPDNTICTADSPHDICRKVGSQFLCQTTVICGLTTPPSTEPTINQSICDDPTTGVPHTTCKKPFPQSQFALCIP